MGPYAAFPGRAAGYMNGFGTDGSFAMNPLLRGGMMGMRGGQGVVRRNMMGGWYEMRIKDHINRVGTGKPDRSITQMQRQD